jgi:hypothetical protein
LNDFPCVIWIRPLFNPRCQRPWLAVLTSCHYDLLAILQTENPHLQIIHHRSPIENSGSSLKHVCWRRRTPFSAQVHNSSHGSCDFIRRLLQLGLGNCQCWDVSYAPNCFKKNVDSCPQTDEIVSFTYRNLIFVGRLGRLRNMHKSCKDTRVSSYFQAWQCFFVVFLVLTAGGRQSFSIVHHQLGLMKLDIVCQSPIWDDSCRPFIGFRFAWWIRLSNALPRILARAFWSKSVDLVWLCSSRFRDVLGLLCGVHIVLACFDLFKRTMCCNDLLMGQLSHRLDPHEATAATLMPELLGTNRRKSTRWGLDPQPAVFVAVLS